MTQILLISMPFVSVRYPSPALSLLKAVLAKEGLKCDVAYLNVLFHAFSGAPRLCDAVADFILIGETVFGKELFGDSWLQSERGRLEELDAPLLPTGSKRDAIRDALLQLRSKASAFIDLCLNKINWNQYSIIGFTSVYSQQVASLALARCIKARYPEKIVAFGGANCEEEMGRALLRLFPFVDWVFNGEADISFPQAVHRWLSGQPPQDVPGVSYRRDGRIIHQGSGPYPDLDSLPYPDFEDYFGALNQWTPDYADFAPLSLELSRGCWWSRKSQCIFCGLNCRKPNYRRKSPQRAQAEIQTLTERYHADRIILTDSVLDMSYFKTLLPELAGRGALEELFIETRANLTREQVRLLKAAGVKSFQPGIEALDTEMLTLMHKGTTLLQNIQLLKWVRECRMYPTWNLLYGFPGETAAAYFRTAALIPFIVHLNPPMDLSPVLLVRFSPLFEQSQQWGLNAVRAHAGYRCIYPFNQEDLNDLACFFDCEHDGQKTVSEYIAPLSQQVHAWKLYWEQPQPPTLTVRQMSGQQILIEDTRPSRPRQQVMLEGATALAYLACDAVQPFANLANQIRGLQGGDYPGDPVLRRQLDDLVTKRLMLSEDDHYLGLATRNDRSLDVSEEW
jgi:ribosomal peptide maturation radical SAM protein 1